MSESLGSDIERPRILNNSYLYRLEIDSVWRYWNSDSLFVGSDSFRHWFEKNKMARLPLKIETRNLNFFCGEEFQTWQEPVTCFFFWVINFENIKDSLVFDHTVFDHTFCCSVTSFSTVVAGKITWSAEWVIQPTSFLSQAKRNVLILIK